MWLVTVISQLCQKGLTNCAVGCELDVELAMRLSFLVYYFELVNVLMFNIYRSVRVLFTGLPGYDHR